MEQIRTCSKGHVLTDENSYFYAQGSKQRPYRRCKTCMKAQSAAWAKRNPDRLRELNRFKDAIYRARHGEEHLERARLRNRKARASDPVKNRRDQLARYGITEADFVSLLEAQRGRCPLCDVELTRKPQQNHTAHVDHSHETGRVRGILCRLCNLALGHFRDDAERMRRAVAYLETRR